MKTKLKYLKLFEGISPSDIPYSDFLKNGYGKKERLHIKIASLKTKIPEIYNQLTNEITGSITIRNMTSKTINTFKNLEKIGLDLSLEYNEKLTLLTGFDNLTKIRGTLYLVCNPKLILMSIPYTIIKSAYDNKMKIILSDNRTNSIIAINDIINHPEVIQDCMYKFDPVIYPNKVVEQIIQNLELWGESDTINTILDHILSKGDYWEYIPYTEKFYEYHHLYNAKHANTGIRSIAKMTTGRYLGVF